MCESWVFRMPSKKVILQAKLLKQSKVSCQNILKAKNLLSVDPSISESDSVALKSKTNCQEKTTTSFPNYSKLYSPKNNDFNLDTAKHIRCVKKANQFRKNEVDIEMLPKSLYQQIFGKDRGSDILPEQVARARKHLSEHDLLDKKTECLPDVNISLPSFSGTNIEEHFYNIAEAQCAPYRQLILSFLKPLPEMPNTWLRQAGWTKYEPGKEACSVPFPSEDAVVFDIEECIQENLGPTLATAVSSTAWYLWVSDALEEVLTTGEKSARKTQFHPSDLINLESNRNESPHQAQISNSPKVVIGHNVSFDRARLKEQYWLQCSGTRFVDTMALHIAVSGVTSFQKIQLAARKTNNQEKELDLDSDEFWIDKSSLNNLSDVHKLYCGGGDIEKSSREIFVQGTLEQVADQFDDLVTYCAKDVKATHEILVALFPRFLERFPHPASFAGMLELSVAYLPVNQTWTTYIRDANQVHKDLEAEAKLLLAKKANEACQLLHDDKYKNDPWLWDQDWSIQDLQLKKKAALQSMEDWDEEDRNDPMAEKFRYLVQQKSLLPVRRPHLPGYPAWYRKLCSQYDKHKNDDEDDSWVPGPTLINSSLFIVPKLLRLTWEGYPLHKTTKHGWGLLIPGRPLYGEEQLSAVPIESISKMCPVPPPEQSAPNISLNSLGDNVEQTISRTDYYAAQRKFLEPTWYQGTGVLCPEVNIPGCWFRKLPHPAGSNRNVGNPLSRDFVTRLSEGTLKGEGAASNLLEIKNSLSYWQNNRDRVASQQVVWLETDSLPRNVRSAMRRENSDTQQVGAIIPQLLVCGTLTRRAVERTWLTASNAVLQRVGSELRAMIRVPPGYHLVGADVDSQELWLAALLGDASFAGIHGATAFGWRTLQGKKSDGTDLHSATAKSANTSRDNAKVMNYARIYGAGSQFAQQLLKRFSPGMSEEEIKKAAVNTINLTKGKRLHYLPASAIETLMELEMCEPAKDGGNKAFLTPWGGFGMKADDGGVYLTYRELDNLKSHEAACGLDRKTSPSSQVKKVWCGGTESPMFNRLEEIANSPAPCTPFLQARLSRALEPSLVGTDNYLTTRVNWVVQSSAVDFLHLMLVCMRWFLGNTTDWRFVISFHDEVRYMVPSEKRYEAALALHVTNLLARSFCARRVGIHDLPRSVAFFSAVEVDLAMRKDANNEYCTPSNPHGLLRGYGIPPGETLDVLATLEKAGKKCLVSSTKSSSTNKK
ncbi:hypothetical protein B566_EDAN017435 [Ephemera danica]|nr:hypothetical protein B566_EDAN017435 [Ephemera danica]